MNSTSETEWFAVRISVGHVARIDVSGELDLAGAPTFQAAVRELDLPSRRRVVLDLSRLTFIDAAGLRAVLDLHAACLSVQTVLTILPGPRHVQRVFELTGADEIVSFGVDRGQEWATNTREEMA